MSGNKKSKPVKIILIAAAALFVLVIAAIYIIAFAKENNLKKAAEAEAAEREEIRSKWYTYDLSAFVSDDYEAAIVTMTGSINWSAEETVEGYLGLKCVKNNDRVTAEEFNTLLETALNSGNDLKNVIMVIDPYRLFSRTPVETEDKKAEPAYTMEKLIDIDYFIEEYPGIEFTVYTALYPDSYWETVSFSEYEDVLFAYRDVLKPLTGYENVKLLCFTGEEWVTGNPDFFDENGNIWKQVYEKLFLYSYIDDRIADGKSYVDAIAKIDENCLVKEAPEEVKKRSIFFPFIKEKEPEPEPLGLEDYDIVFMGDSIFALAGLTYSIPTIIENKTGARTYNISKGGMTAAPFEDNFHLSKAVDAFLSGSLIEGDDFVTFNIWLNKFLTDTHDDRKLCFVFDAMENDYMASIEVCGDSPETFEGATKTEIKRILEKYPDAKIILTAPYDMPLLSYGTVENGNGDIAKDYKDAMKKIAEDEGWIYFNMQDYVHFSEENVAPFLDDAAHPSIAGCYKIGNTLAPAFIEALGDPAETE